MFDIPDEKIFMDSVHGYIRIPKVFVDNIIDTSEFQRLRYIDQTGMRILYPSAKHDRFSHSLGVYHLGRIAVDSLLLNFKESKHWNILGNNDRFVFWAKNKVLFLIACLLHDVGHSPFSHSLEKFLYVDDLNLEVDIGITGDESVDFRRAPNHEKMSARFVLDKFMKPIEDVLCSLNVLHYPKPSEQIYAEHTKKSDLIDSCDIDNDVKFIARMILGVKYSNYEEEAQIRNCFIELLNSSNFDVDKLDYIVRDTKMSGISNTTLDIERLLGSLTIVPTTKYVNYEFDDISGDFTHGVLIKDFEQKETECVTIIGEADSPVRIMKGKVIIKAGSRFSLEQPRNAPQTLINLGNAEFDNKSEIYINSVRLLPSSVEPDKIVAGGGSASVACRIVNAHIISTKDFVFTMGENEQEIGTYEIMTKAMTDAEICHLSLNAQARMNSCWFKGKIIGTCTTEILEDILGRSNQKSTPSIFTGFSIGFKKQAMSIISNVTEARNYLYLWIYAHHKVVYYANFLVGELSQHAAAKITKKKLRELLCYDNLTERDDTYMISLFRSLNDGIETKELYNEFSTRKYKRSLFKSLAEYDAEFKDFNDLEKMEIKKLLESSSADIPDMESPQTLKYGFVKKDILDEMSLPFLNELLWVDASLSPKSIDSHAVFICFSPSKVVMMDRLPVLETKELSKKSTAHYFYLYYTIDDIRFNEYEKEHSDDMKTEKEHIIEGIITYINKEFSKQKKEIAAMETGDSLQ